MVIGVDLLVMRGDRWTSVEHTVEMPVEMQLEIGGDQLRSVEICGGRWRFGEIGGDRWRSGKIGGDRW